VTEGDEDAVFAPTVWLGQSVDTSSICSGYRELRNACFLTSLGCAIRRPSLLKTHFNTSLRTKLSLYGPLMIDSGGFALSVNPGAKWTIRAVADCIAHIDADVFVSLDYPPALSDFASVRRSKIAASTRNFEILAERFPNKIIMPVVHGRTIRELELSISSISKNADALKWVGLGGMVPLLRGRHVSKDISQMGPKIFIAKALSLIRKTFARSRIHVFGGGGTQTFPAVYSLGAASADSIGWRHAAGFGSIFLPLKSQRLISWEFENRPPRRLLDSEDLTQLEMCGCPVCNSNISIKSKLNAFRVSFHNRSIHNAWTVANQSAFWPTTRSGLISLIADGKLGRGWAKAVSLFK
jgi:queuine/archaeosine tRNA-ribosyltransferase